jgi:ring-1,2-phenylacetyl-CoA epoxidase subunit PaaD
MVKRAIPAREELFSILDTVMDPEVPVLSVVELGIVREVVATDEGGAVVTVTPTYSGCPAMREIETEIRRALEDQGIGPVTIRTTYAPAWTTDWIAPEARAKLEAYGIAPPGPVERGRPYTRVPFESPPGRKFPTGRLAAVEAEVVRSGSPAGT